MWCSFPHGIFPVGTILGGTYHDWNYKRYISKGMTIKGVVASVLFNVPLMRHLNAWMGAKPATKEGIAECFKTGSCAIFPGGIAEMFLTKRDSENVYVKKRFGFVKSAIIAGADLVPVYYFGQSILLDTLGNSWSGWSWISRKLRASLVFYYGRYFLPVPYRVPLLMVVGPPVAVRQNPAPTNEEIQETLNRFIQALEQLYHQYKHLYGWEARPFHVH